MKHLMATLIALNCFLTHSQVDWDLRFSDDVMNIAFGDEHDFLTTRTSVFRSNAGMNEWTECNWTLGIVRDGTSVLNGLSWNNERLVVAAMDNGYFMSEDLGESFVQTGPTGFGCGSESILHLDEGELVATMGGFQRGLWKCGQSPSTNWSRNYSVGADQRDIQQVGEHLFAVSHSPNHPGGILESSDYGGSWQLVFGTQYSGNPSSYVILENTLIFISWDGVVHHIDMTDWSELTSFSSAIVSPSDMLEVEGALFLASYDGGVYRSEDLGQTWEDIGPNNSSFYRLVLHGDDLFAAGETGLWSVHAPGPSGCTDPMSCNYNAEAEEDDGSCLPYDALAGCVDETACNFNVNAFCADDSCIYPPFNLSNCDEGEATCGPGTMWDSTTQLCVVANPADTDFDGCVQLNDLLDVLSAYGNCAADESVWQCGDPLEYQGYEYETVLIGEQCWFAENLKAENYRNDEAIPLVVDDIDWDNIDGDAVRSSPAPNTHPNAGQLYTFFVVSDERGVCPSGWHVPSHEEWIILELHLGLDEVELENWGQSRGDLGLKLKSCSDWNGDCSMQSGFNAVYSSVRPGNGPEDGGYSAEEISAYWSSTPDVGAWYRSLDVNSIGIHAWNDGDGGDAGYSIRCIKDSE